MEVQTASGLSSVPTAQRDGTASPHYQTTGDRGPSTQTLLDENIVNQVYQSYVKLLANDKNAKVRDIITREPFLGYLQQGMLNEQDIESAVLNRNGLQFTNVLGIYKVGKLQTVLKSQQSLP